MKTKHIIAIALLPSLIIGLLIYTNYDLRIRQMAGKKEEEAMQKYHACRSVSEELYDDNWENECQSLGRGEDCRLPIYIADSLNDDLEKEIDRCIKLYIK